MHLSILVFVQKVPSLHEEKSTRFAITVLGTRRYTTFRNDKVKIGPRLRRSKVFLGTGRLVQTIIAQPPQGKSGKHAERVKHKLNYSNEIRI